MGWRGIPDGAFLRLEALPERDGNSCCCRHFSDAAIAILNRRNRSRKSANLAGVILLHMKDFRWITFAVGALFVYADDAKGCSVVRISQVDPAIEVVQGSAVIVRARAVGYVTEPESHIGSIRFSVSEVLRGQPLSELTLHGELVDRDDFNTGRVPYNSVRPNGLSGSCYAWQYKAGAEYLLMLSYLKSRELGLSPFPLEPVNEQLRSSEDAWLLWVRKQTKRWRPKSSRKAPK